MVDSYEKIDTEGFWVEKKDTFIKLKLWADETSSKLQRIRRILEQITSYTFSKLLRGKEISVAIAKYMKEHSAADSIYSSQLKNQLIYLPPPNTQYSDPLKSGLSVLNQVQSALSLSFRDLSQNIENIVNTQLAINLIDLEKTTSESSTLWSSASTETNSLIQKLDRAYKEYLNIFVSQEAEISKKGLVTSCLWLAETRYLGSVESLYRHLVSCSILTKNFWDMLISAENSRIETLKKAIYDFVGFHDNVYKIQANEIFKLLDAPGDQIEITMTIGSEDLAAIENEFGTGDLFERIIQWSLPQAPKSLLVIKEGPIDRETALFKVWKASYGVLTSDRFLHIFNEDPKTQFEQPINTCVIHKASIIENDELYFEIIEAKQIGLLSKFAAPRRSVFKLHALNDFLEWIKAIRQLL